MRVVYRGYLFPFGHRASLVKITERKFYPEGGRHVAYLFQRMFIIMREPVKDYGAPNLKGRQGVTYPFFEGPMRDRSIDRWMPFKPVQITTITTPNINAPAMIPGVSGKVNPQDGFWPQVGGQDFLFHLVARDIEGQRTEFTAPLAFVAYGPQVAFSARAMQALAKRYPGALWPENVPRRARPTNGQDVAFAPGSKPGNTTLHTQELTFGAFVPGDLVPLGSDQPRFFPIVAAAAVRIPALEALLHTGQIPQIRISDHFLIDGMGGANAGEVFAEIIDAAKPVVTFGGKDPASSGGTGTPGLVTPNLAITGLSRVLGPVGGDVAKVASGRFGGEDAAKAFIKYFFSDTAKILGAIALSDIIDTSTMDRLEGVFGALSLLQSLHNYPLAISALAAPAFAAGAGSLAALPAPALAALRGQLGSLQGQLSGLQGYTKAIRSALQALPSGLLPLGKPTADLDALLTEVNALVPAMQALLTNLDGHQLGAAEGNLAALNARSLRSCRPRLTRS